MARTSAPNTMKNFLEALVAVLGGNAIYFLIAPYLPTSLRHHLFREDWGLAVDFIICAALFAAIKILFRPATNPKIR